MFLKFIKRKDPKNSYDFSNVEYSLESVNLDEIVNEFKHFLYACGFCESQIKQVFNEEDEE